MSNEEFKEYINKTLGNSIRCLLPSYWWKRLFGLVVDKIDEVDGKLAEVDGKVNKLPTKSYIDDAVKDKASEQYVDDAVKDKQDTLVSGTNIKTVNGESVLGEGNIEVASIILIVPVIGNSDYDEIREWNKERLSLITYLNMGRVVIHEVIGPINCPAIIPDTIVIDDSDRNKIIITARRYNYHETLYGSDIAEVHTRVKFTFNATDGSVVAEDVDDGNVIYIGDVDNSLINRNKLLLKAVTPNAALSRARYYTDGNYVDYSLIGVYISMVLIGNFYEECIVISIYHNGSFEDWYVVKKTGEVGRFTTN
jgi:hypothetical protein